MGEGRVVYEHMATNLFAHPPHSSTAYHTHTAYDAQKNDVIHMYTHKPQHGKVSPKKYTVAYESNFQVISAIFTTFCRHAPHSIAANI